MDSTSYRVMEHFCTLQGEGFYSGRAAYFIRLSGCDVGCVWCDVKESWNADFGELLTASMLGHLTSAQDFVVITGGEPAMQDLNALCIELHALGKYIAIETSGCYPLKGDIDWYTFSPKKFKKPIAEAYEKANELKVVVFHPSDLAWAESHAEKVNESCLLFLQPEWEKRDELLPLIISYVQRNPQWKLSLQTHKYLNIP